MIKEVAFVLGVLAVTAPGFEQGNAPGLAVVMAQAGCIEQGPVPAGHGAAEMAWCTWGAAQGALFASFGNDAAAASWMAWANPRAGSAVVGVRWAAVANTTTAAQSLAARTGARP